VAQKSIILILFIGFCSFRAVSQNIQLIDSLRDKVNTTEGMTKLAALKALFFTVSRRLTWENNSTKPSDWQNRSISLEWLTTIKATE
jgi:hypothetical protein